MSQDRELRELFRKEIGQGIRLSTGQVIPSDEDSLRQLFMEQMAKGRAAQPLGPPSVKDTTVLTPPPRISEPDSFEIPLASTPALSTGVDIETQPQKPFNIMEKINQALDVPIVTPFGLGQQRKTTFRKVLQDIEPVVGVLDIAPQLFREQFRRAGNLGRKLFTDEEVTKKDVIEFLRPDNPIRDLIKSIKLLPKRGAVFGEITAGKPVPKEERFEFLPEILEEIGIPPGKEFEVAGLKFSVRGLIGFLGEIALPSVPATKSTKFKVAKKVVNNGLRGSEKELGITQEVLEQTAKSQKQILQRRLGREELIGAKQQLGQIEVRPTRKPIRISKEVEAQEAVLASVKEAKQQSILVDKAGNEFRISGGARREGGKTFVRVKNIKTGKEDLIEQSRLRVKLEPRATAKPKPAPVAGAKLEPPPSIKFFEDKLIEKLERMPKEFKDVSPEITVKDFREHGRIRQELSNIAKGPRRQVIKFDLLTVEEEEFLESKDLTVT